MRKGSDQTPRRISRRDLLKIGGSGALFAAMSSVGLAKILGSPAAAPAEAAPLNLTEELPDVHYRLVATDGFMSFPGREFDSPDGGIYFFGYRDVDPGDTFRRPERLIQKYKGIVTMPSPLIGVPKDVNAFITLTNLGLVIRPDLDDSHTIHWHGFRNPTAVFDGVPELSISVPVARDFPYLFRPRDEGTYMYHCHFEDVEHVQMGMDGIIYIEADNGRTYDDDGGTTGFSREFALLFTEIDTRPHDMLRDVQEFVWSEYKANYWCINGRSYPDTLLRDQELPDSQFDLGGGRYSQPISSLIQVAGGDTALLRIANLGYEQQSIQLLGIPMRVVAHDASFLGNNAYDTHTLYIGPGEARDVLMTAPGYSGDPDGSDDAGSYDRYWLRNRNSQRLVNGNDSGLGGQITEVRVYSSLPDQPGPSKTI